MAKVGFRTNNLAALLFLMTLALGADTADYYLAFRQALTLRIDERAFLAAPETGVSILDRRVMAAIANVPRHLYVPPQLQAVAYHDVPIPLGHGQNISTPFLVALMTDLAEVTPDDVVFETGTGAGYHAAILGELCRQVYSVEVIEPLAEKAAAILKNQGVRNVEIRAGDGYFGWPERGPFDAILVKEAVDHLPLPLLAQLKPGGRMVIPLGPSNGMQQLTIVEKDLTGAMRKRAVLEVRFSPLQGGRRI